MKFSDILKKKTDSEPPLPPPRAPAPEAARSILPAGSPTAPASEETDEAADRRAEADAVEAKTVYTEALVAARALYKAAPSAKASTLRLPNDVIAKTIALHQAGNEEILALADRSTPDHYLFGHVANVTIFSLRLGGALRLSGPEMELLATGAFLHDLGMMNVMTLAEKPAKLTPQEAAQIQRHPYDSQKMVDLFADLRPEFKDELRQIVGQVHERAGGTGYPERRRSENIHRFAKIIGVCDVYEAVTHVRAPRQRALPHEALRLMIDKHEMDFDPGTVKLLIEALSLYPPGSYVRLNSGEVGRVLFTNPGLPTRPKVKIVMDARGNRAAGTRIVNLATQPILYIAEAVDETRLNATDPRFVLELRAQRWWVKGL